MRRLPQVALLASALALTPALMAQHGAAGGHAGGFSGGGHISGGFGRGLSGPSGFSAPHFSAGFAGRGTSASPRMTFTAPAHAFAPGYRIRYTAARGAWAGDRGGRSHDGGWRRGRGGPGHNGDRYRSPYRGLGGYGYYPGYASSSELIPWDIGYPDFTGDSGYGDDEGQPAYAEAQQGDNEEPSQDYSQNYPPYSGYAPPADSGYRAPYSAGLAAPPPPADREPVSPEPELTLIFRDGHQQGIHNYVVTPSTVIVLDEADSGRQQRIPLAELNVAATEKAARDAGLDFSPPV